MSEYQSNSHKQKEEQQRRKPVVSEKAVIHKKSGVWKFVDSICGELTPRGADLLVDVIAPAIRKALYDVIVDGASAIFGWGVDGTSRNIKQVSYNKQYQSRNDDTRPSVRYSRVRYDFGEPIFSSRADASDVLDTLYEIVREFGVVSVADYLASAGINDFDYTADNYGWTNLSGARIVSARDGWTIKMPPAIAIGR